MHSQSEKKASARQVDKFRRLARFVIEHHYGSKPARIKYKSGGLSNFVFEANHSEGNFIIRVSPDKGRLNAFVKEHWCERAARKAGIPTAEILETGVSVIPFPYMIARSIEGIGGTEHPEREKIIFELGRIAAKINSIRTRGFGETFDWSNNELSHNRTFADYLENEYRYEGRLETLERSRLCPPETIRSIKRIAPEFRKIKTRPALSHGDLRLKNVIADESGKIQAIIDWEKATSNIAPHWELSIALHDFGIDRQQQFLKGYGIRTKRLMEIAPFIKAFNLLNYSDAITLATATKDKLTMDSLRVRFAGVLDLYSL
jgi:aminoglycoside phosphotransferase (APT) family kinase protein